MKRALLLVALLPMMAFADVKPNFYGSEDQKAQYQMTCYPPNQPVQKQYIKDYQRNQYGFKYIRLDGLEIYSTMQCEIFAIPEQK